MSHVLLDTHVWAWSLTGDLRLSAKAIDSIKTADSVSISAISLYEIGQKVRLGKWPEMAPYLADLCEIAAQQGGKLISISPSVCAVASVLDWTHRDPFDRIIGLTALLDGLTLISADIVFDELKPQAGWRDRIW